MKPQAPEAFAAFVGLDWADAKHAICVQAAGTARREFLISNTALKRSTRGPRVCTRASMANLLRCAWSSIKGPRVCAAPI